MFTGNFFLVKEWKLTIFAVVSISASRTALTTETDGPRSTDFWTIFWTIAFVCRQVILSRCVSSTEEWLLFPRRTASSAEGVLDGASRLDLASGAFWEVTADLRTCRMWKASELENWLPRSFFCFPLRSETRQVRMLREAVRSGWLRVKGILLVGQISWMFWEAAAGGRVRRPFPPNRARKREWEGGWCGTE